MNWERTSSISRGGPCCDTSNATGSRFKVYAQVPWAMLTSEGIEDRLLSDYEKEHLEDNHAKNEDNRTKEDGNCQREN